MPRETEDVEKIAKLETQFEFLRSNDEQFKAELQQTTREFREAFEKHRDEHEGKAKRSTDTFWKIVAIAIGLLAIISNVITAFVVARLSS